ncbi:hypothetical protein RDWZM_008594, partial [Blomia tropicalis]
MHIFPAHVSLYNDDADRGSVTRTSSIIIISNVYLTTCVLQQGESSRYSVPLSRSDCAISFIEDDTTFGWTREYIRENPTKANRTTSDNLDASRLFILCMF